MRTPPRHAGTALAILLCSALALAQDPALYYGPGINAESLSNTRAGGPDAITTGWRFRATHSDNLVSFKHYIIWSTARAGYDAGDGGTLLYELRTDDGSSGHWPSNTILASVTLNSPKSGNHFPTLTWPTPVPLTTGTIYHITCRNIHSDPANNYVSLDNLFTYTSTHPVNPTTTDLNWAVLLKFGSGGWSMRGGETPILELEYADGFKAGQGQMEVWVGNPKSIGGSSAVREHFTVSGGDRKVAEASIWIERVSGSGSLTMTLEQGGTQIEAVSVPSGSVTTSYRWVNFPFSTPRTLGNDQTYDLKFTAPSGTVYQTYPLSDGSHYYGFDKRTVFGDGLAQFTTGSSWVGWDQWGTPNRPDGDLQFYFKLSPSSTPPAPALSISTSSLQDFGQVNVGSDSPAKSFTVSGTDLTGNITVAAPSEFQVSLSSSNGFGQNVSLSPTNATVPSTSVYVRLSPLSDGTKAGTVAATAPGATSRQVTVSGTGKKVAASNNKRNHYGTGVNSIGLTHSVVGGAGQTAMSWRFRAGTSGWLESFKHYVLWTSSAQGYNAGSGGSLQYKLRTDDGTSHHGPTSTVLATVTLDNPASGTHFPVVSWPSPVALDSGSIYHITCENVDPDPVNNFVSINNLLSSSGVEPVCPAMHGIDWVVLQRSGGNWSVREAEMPILELRYSDGFAEGQGYMEVWIGNPKSISGASAVREQFTPGDDGMTVSQTSIWLRRVGGTEHLHVTLERADGTDLDEVSVSPSEVPTDYGWVTCQFKASQLLVKGQTYNLLFSAPSGTAYETYALRDGSVNYGFTDGSVFASGFAQFSTGGAWTGWDQWDTTDRRDADLQFFLSLAEPLVAPVVSLPGGSEQLAPDNVVLEWAGPAEATSFQIQVSVDSLFSNKVIDTVVVVPVLDCSGRLAASEYFVHVRSIADGQVSPYSSVTCFTVAGSGTEMEESGEKPLAFRLHPNYPNPFNPTTTVSFEIPKSGQVSLKIFNSLGSEVAELVNGNLNAGSHTLVWKAERMASGTYFCRLIAEGRRAMNKMLLVR